MRVAKWYNNKDIRIEEVPTPSPGPNDMLVRVISCGICGSDVVEWYRLPRAPLVQGHEIGAEVVAVGESTTKFKPGDRVFIAPKVPCLKCSYCKGGHYPVCTTIKERLPGGFAEYVLATNTLIEHGAYRLPDTIAYDQSTFIEPLACVVRAQRLAGVRENQTVMILGCGMSGMLHLKLAKAKKCRVVVTDVNPKRLEFAAGFGADVTIDAAEDAAERLTASDGKKADVVILCTSATAAIDQAWKNVDKGGVVVFFAVPGPDKQVTIPITDFWTQEIQILTSYYCGPPDITDAMDLIASKNINVEDMITHKFNLNEIARGFQAVLEGKESLKVIIEPNR